MNRQRSSSLYNKKLATLAVILLGLAVISWMVMRYSRSPMIRLAELEFVRIQNLQPPDLRSNTLRRGLQALYDQDYASALITFGGYTQEHPDSFSGYFYSGLTRLKRAPLRMLGVTLAFDPESVQLAVQDLQNALEYTTDMKQRADCLWFLAKAHLMRNDLNAARNKLEKIIHLEDPAPDRAEDARGMLQRLSPLKGD